MPRTGGRPDPTRTMLTLTHTPIDTAPSIHPTHTRHPCISGMCYTNTYTLCTAEAHQYCCGGHDACAPQHPCSQHTTATHHSHAHHPNTIHTPIHTPIHSHTHTSPASTPMSAQYSHTRSTPHLHTHIRGHMPQVQTHPCHTHLSFVFASASETPHPGSYRTLVPALAGGRCECRAKRDEGRDPQGCIGRGGRYPPPPPPGRPAYAPAGVPLTAGARLNGIRNRQQPPPTALATTSNPLPNRFWDRLGGPFPSTASLGIQPYIRQVGLFGLLPMLSPARPIGRLGSPLVSPH